MTIQILPLGSYFEIDSEGYIINPASLDKIQPEWKLAVDAVIQVYKKGFGDKIKAIYLRGSVPRGKAVANVSDIDTIAFVDMSIPKIKEIRSVWKKESRTYLHEQFPFVVSFELDPCPLEYIQKETILLNQSVLIYGVPSDIPRLKIGDELVMYANSPNFHKLMLNPETLLDQEKTDDEIKKRCVWYMTTILRAGFDLCIEKSGRYTRDLYKCYETFAELYPDNKTDMKEVLYLALNPINDKEKITAVIKGIGGFVASEAKGMFVVRSKY